MARPKPILLGVTEAHSILAVSFSGVRLGIKVKPEVEGKNPYPRATDYFVIPDDIKKYLDEKPKRLNIMFPTEEVDKFAQQWLRCYSFTQGLVCRGDGHVATRKIDVENGDIARISS
ncbi:hypothetical protein ES708_29745 [subsurface metagenome]